MWLCIPLGQQSLLDAGLPCGVRGPNLQPRCLGRLRPRRQHFIVHWCSTGRVLSFVAIEVACFFWRMACVAVRWQRLVSVLQASSFGALPARLSLQSVSCVLLKVLDPILWSTLHFSTPLRPNHRRHTFTTAATVCLGCGLSLNVHSETYQRIGL